MRTVNIHEAKTTLSKLVEAAEAGEKIVLARAGKPVAEIVRLAKPQSGIRLGVLKSKLPERLLEQISRPLTRREMQRLFERGLEP
jgi:prevent-host-death family protein